MAPMALGEQAEDTNPVIPAGASYTAALDAVFELLCRAGRDAPVAKLMLVPEAWSKDSTMNEARQAMYAYFASVMEPWDGPAALAMTDGRSAVAGVDRSAPRPLRYSITNQGLPIVGSEPGMVVVPESHTLKQGRLAPGPSDAAHLHEGPP